MKKNEKQKLIDDSIVANKKKESEKRWESREDLLNTNLLNSVGRSLAGKPQDQEDLKNVLEVTMLIKREDGIKRSEAVQNGKKGGRRPTFKKEEILKQYEELQGKHPKFTKTHLSEMLAEKLDVSERNIRRILSDILVKRTKK
jgi:hypothetical protein